MNTYKTMSASFGDSHDLESPGSYNKDHLYLSLFGQPIASGTELISFGLQAKIVVENFQH